MGLKADIKTSFSTNLSAADEDRLLEAFFYQYGYSRDGLDLQNPGDRAAIADKAVTDYLQMLKDFIKGYEAQKAQLALGTPDEITVN